MLELEVKNNCESEQHLNIWEEGRRERQVLKHAIKAVYDQRAQGLIPSRGELQQAIARIFIGYVQDNILEPYDLEKFIFWPKLAIYRDGSLNYSNSKVVSGEYQHPSGYDPNYFDWMSWKGVVTDRVIHRVMFFKNPGIPAYLQEAYLSQR